MHQFRYSRASFINALMTSLGLAALGGLVVYLFFRLGGFSYAGIATWTAGVLFFVFFSFRALWLFMQNEVVLAVRPDGLYDARLSPSHFSWEDLWEINLTRLESDYRLELRLWPKTVISTSKKHAGRVEDIEIETSSLDGGIEEIVAAIQKYKPVTIKPVL
ncbi:MAG: hypothetical protein AAF468_05950 [Pseudomonadota bacterium]